MPVAKLKKKISKKEKEALALSFYESKGWKMAPFQKKVLSTTLKGQNGLLNVPTGFGKTNALMMPIVLDGLENYSKSTKSFAIWITPLRALAKDIASSALELTDFFDLKWKVATRNGDTSTSERAKQKRKPPQVLITTPESLHLLLATKGYEQVFGSLEYFIVDEWHELLGTKRGVQIELALSRLKTIAPKMKIWGISATIGNLDEAKQVLFGNTNYDLPITTVGTQRKKKIKIKSILPDELEEYPWAGHLGVKMAHKIVPIIEKHTTTLIFTNTRAQAEIWYQNLLKIAPQLAGLIALHHGSIGRELRDWVENALHKGTLKAVVCTSSLDLGVDFRPVDVVIQIGGPKGVARFLQRAGRSGHSPKETSLIYFMPTHSLELMEAAALKEAVKLDHIESRYPYVRSFDVLAQYLVTLAVSGGFYPQEIFKEVLQTHCFSSISDAEWNWLLIYITQGGKALYAYEKFHKVVVQDNGLYAVENKRIAMRHRLSIGTIVSDTNLQVKFLKGGFIGTIEEYFISKLKPGEVFWFSGRNLELVRVKENTALVRHSKAKKLGKVPSWQGGRMPLSSMLGNGLREQLEHVSSGNLYSPELKSLGHTFKKQEALSAVPAKNELLLETFKTREGYHLVVYPFEGRFVHEGLGSLLAYRISLLKPISFSIAVNDYGFELLSDQPIPVQEALDNDFFTPDFLSRDLDKSINSTEMARRLFREIAPIAGLVFQGYPGKDMKEKHLQASSQLYFSIFRDYDPTNLFLAQAYEEAYYHQLEEGRMRAALNRIQELDILWTQPEKPTPLAFPIMVDRLRAKLSSEKLEDRIKKMQVSFSK